MQELDVDPVAVVVRDRAVHAYPDGVAAGCVGINWHAENRRLVFQEHLCAVRFSERDLDPARLRLVADPPENFSSYVHAFSMTGRNAYGPPNA